MSEKVVLTQEQAKLIEELKGVAYAVNLLDMGNKYPLSELKVSELVRAFNGHYEIEKPKFQVGDKVVNDDGTPIHGSIRIATYEGADVFGLHVLEEFSGTFIGSDLRHATPEEIFWLHELERNYIGDFREGDVILANSGEWTVIEKQHAHKFNDKGVLNTMKGIYPAESFKPLKKEQPK